MIRVHVVCTAAKTRRRASGVPRPRSVAPAWGFSGQYLPRFDYSSAFTAGPYRPGGRVFPDSNHNFCSWSVAAGLVPGSAVFYWSSS